MISSILSLSKLSILINRTPHGYFSCSRGVRQGDPLFPLLFCLAEEAFIRWIDHYIDMGYLTTHRKLSRHLLYADDILIFLEATRANRRCIKSLLDGYGSLSGQMFSPPNSSIFYSPTASHNLICDVTEITSISIGSLPFKYLGVLIFKGSPKVEHLLPIADSIIQIFSRWRGHILSLAGRHCLINSVIASSLVHTMMIYRWPKSLLYHLEVAIRSYLWTGDTNRKGFCNVDWK